MGEGESYDPTWDYKNYESTSLHAEFADYSTCDLGVTLSACQSAWEVFESACTSYSNQHCDGDCQTMADAVLSTCTEGESYDPGRDYKNYESASLYAEFADYSTCGLGVTLSACQSAWKVFESACTSYF